MDKNYHHKICSRLPPKKILIYAAIQFEFSVLKWEDVLQISQGITFSGRLEETYSRFGGHNHFRVKVVMNYS